ncbi:MAG: hypothetical protein LBP61_04055 [Desulfovibrio sp.]|jgi:hypothetical protein|nr:hypothetical protein [Desulfovibrio sp.]
MSSDFLATLAGMDALIFLGLASLVFAAFFSAVSLVRNALCKEKRS